MLGAIYGDIIGSRFEFDRGGKTKDFELFTDQDEFTDDTVMTVAVAEGLLNAGKDASVDEIKKELVKYMQKWGRKYPNAGYGARFIHWVFSSNPQPYGSFGNGSAMRVASAGWLYDSLERTMEVARATAEISHNHPEGIKGAEATAAVIYLSRTGSSKKEIREFVEKTYDYDLSKSVDQLRKHHQHVETCMDSLPKALVSFFEGESYEDVVRNAVSLGGDTDTLGAIAGSMAEAFYGMPVMIVARGNSYLPEEMQEVLKRFNRAIGRIPDEEESEDNYEDNKYIKMAVDQLYEKRSQESFFTILDVLLKRILEDGQAPTPMDDVNRLTDTIDLETMKYGDQFQFEDDLRLRIDTVQDPEDNLWIPLFTDEEELNRQPTANITVNMDIGNLLSVGVHDEGVAGVIINPFGKFLKLEKDVLDAILTRYEEVKMAN